MPVLFGHMVVGPEIIGSPVLAGITNKESGILLQPSVFWAMTDIQAGLVLEITQLTS